MFGGLSFPEIISAHNTASVQVSVMPSLARGARNERVLHLLNPTMSYFSVDGLVSGIKSHMIEAASKPTDAILRNVAAQSKFAAASPKSAVLSAAPSPDAVPTMH
jgi:hypothetical protein